MTTYALPTTLAPTSLEWGLRSNTWEFVSILSGDVQTLEMPGARWVASFDYKILSNIRAPEFEAFLTKLRGKANRFTAYNFFRSVPRGTMRGSPVVSGGYSKFATTITISASGQGVTTLLAGDYLSIGGELKMVKDDVILNGSGVGNINIEPPMRQALVNGTAITWDRPTATFVLDDREVRWVYDQTALKGVAFSATEVW